MTPGVVIDFFQDSTNAITEINLRYILPICETPQWLTLSTPEQWAVLSTVIYWESRGGLMLLNTPKCCWTVTRATNFKGTYYVKLTLS